MAFSEETFNLKNTENQTIYGVIHHPDRPNGGLVIMFNIGLHYRVCHSRLFVRQARELQASGYYAVRFDMPGTGYSHGEMPIGRAIDTFDAIQTGYFKNDALLTVKYLRKRLKPKKMYFYGLCGGALTGIIAAAVDKNIDGVIFVAGPILVTSAEAEQSSMHPIDADMVFSMYLRRALSPRAWARFFSGKSSYKDLFASLKVKFTKRLPSSKSKQLINVDVDDNDTKGKHGFYNRVFHKSFDNLVKSGKKVLFVMPDYDRAAYDFKRIFVKYIMKDYSEYPDYFNIEEIPKANHTFSTRESSRQLFDTTIKWLNKELISE